MTKDQVIEVVGFYRDTLARATVEESLPQSGLDRLFGRPAATRGRALGSPKRWLYDEDQDSANIRPGDEDQLRHAWWMSEAILDGLRSGSMSEGKAFRWLGFLQGILWCQAIFTLEDLKSHNRSPASDA